jgi:hypothetical protein
MINKNLIRDILSQYKKHGWNLRRVLLLPQTKKDIFDSLEMLFGESEIDFSEINAAWFSRPSANKREAWELRHLNEIPFALFETFEENIDKDVLREKLNEMETNLKEKTSKIG